jgi:DNA-binding YbaB/EbfC family protein
MFKGLGNLASMMQQATQIKDKMDDLNLRLKSERVSASTGGGMVEVETNGLGEILRVSIEPGLIESGERELIEDLIPAAVNQAIAKSKELHIEAMKTITEGMSIPGLDQALSQFTSPGSG